MGNHGIGMSSLGDRPFVIAFSLSVACHLLFLTARLVQWRQQIQATHAKALDVIYEYQVAEHDLRHLQRQLAKRAEAPSGMQAPVAQIRIPDRPAVTLSASPSDPGTARAAVVDLTNLVEAAQGDPVLLSYFSAIREQIQQTANQHIWPPGKTDQGLVYVSFLLRATGQMESATVLSERSVPTAFLHETAMKILHASSPFPPFPPSMPDASKTVVVPLEFLLGSSQGP